MLRTAVYAVTLQYYITRAVVLIRWRATGCWSDPCETVFCPFWAQCVIAPSTSTELVQCRCRSNCSSTFAPVCGTDNVTYTSDCHLQVSSQSTHLIRIDDTLIATAVARITTKLQRRQLLQLPQVRSPSHSSCRISQLAHSCCRTAPAGWPVATPSECFWNCATDGFVEHKLIVIALDTIERVSQTGQLSLSSFRGR